MIPDRLTSPTVGLIPTKEFAEEGHTTEPSVSVPIAAAHRFADGATPEPELEPHGFLSSAYGFFVCPPRPLQPLDEWFERKFAHSLKFVFPRITAPASRSRLPTKASRVGFEPMSAVEPAVVCMRSWVSMLSLINMGMPCKGPRTRPSLRSWSSLVAIESASGLSSITEFKRGPSLSISLIRSTYFSTRDRAEYLPDAMCLCRSVIDNSSNSKSAAG